MGSPVTDFTGKVVVITGGASGIGKNLGQAFTRAGAVVVLADIEKPALDAAVAELNAATGAEATGAVTGIVTDVSDHTSVEALAGEVYRQHGATHVLVNNAGVGPPSAKAWETTPNDWRWTFNVNVFGVAHGVQAFVPRMIASGEPGYVVNTSSGDGAIQALPSAAPYAASKAAVAVLTECLAAQFVEEGLPLAASLFLPSGNGILDTGLWTADRNRPAELTRERPRETAAITVATLRERVKKAGGTLPVQSLDELSQVVLDGIRAGRYCITIGLDDAVRQLRGRAERFGRGENPTEAGHTVLPV
jgi:NAD(P)-dependent dehydrogenase (short-subunit alcohol dehydrogenase family)